MILTEHHYKDPVRDFFPPFLLHLFFFPLSKLKIQSYEHYSGNLVIMIIMKSVHAVHMMF